MLRVRQPFRITIFFLENLPSWGEVQVVDTYDDGDLQ